MGSALVRTRFSKADNSKERDTSTAAVNGDACMLIKVPARKTSKKKSKGGPCSPSQDSAEQQQGSAINAEDTPAFKLMLLLQELNKGVVPPIKDLKKAIVLAADTLTRDRENGNNKSEEGSLEQVRNSQVREWLASTFTRTDSAYEACKVTMSPIIRFKAAANTIIIGQYLGSIHREHSVPSEIYYPEALTQHFQEDIGKWEFDPFKTDSLSGHHPLRYIGYELFKKHDLFEKCALSASSFDVYMSKIEEGYGHHSNPYHNACHGADVAHTVHFFIYKTGLKGLMTDLEVMSLLLAALIHDVDHPGTSNSFQINQQSEYALLYNDRSVLEHHHLSFSFKLLQQINFMKDLSAEEYKLMRGLVIDMVLATDMSFHFDQLKMMKQIMSLPDALSQLMVTERTKVFNLLLHIADISHPGKPWYLHKLWSEQLAEEFYRQGDEEKSLGQSPSPLCDRNNTKLPESQLGFIEYIVAPSFDICGDLLELLLTAPQLSNRLPPLPENSPTPESSHQSYNRIIWERYLIENKEMWREEAQKRACAAMNKDTGEDDEKEKGHEDHGESTSERSWENGEGQSGGGKDKQSQSQKEEENVSKHKEESIVETTQTISTVETRRTSSQLGAAELKTIKKMELRKITTNQATVIEN